MSDDRAPAPQSMKQSVTGWVQLALIVAVVVGALATNRILSAGEGGGPPVSATAAPPAVAVISPALTNEVIRVTETGTVRARANVAVAPQVGGRVVEVAPQLAAGGAFAAGDLLFAIDPRDFELALRQADADLDSALSSLLLEEAEAETARREWRLVNGEEPIPALVAREPQIAQARATVASAKARLDDARTDLERTRYALPFDGRVLRTTVEVGQTLAANQSYGEVYADDALEVLVSIPTDALATLGTAVGRPAVVRAAGAPNAAGVPARVARIEAELDAQTRLAGLVLTFDGAPDFLPGSFVSVEITGDQVDGVFSLPADVLAAEDGVWVVEAEALAARRPTVLARRDDVVLVSPFDVADGVVTTVPPGARDGLPVHVAGADAADAPVSPSGAE